MEDLRAELAGLVADVAATVESLRALGVIGLPVGERGGAPLPLPASPDVVARGAPPERTLVRAAPPAARPAASGVRPPPPLAPRAEPPPPSTASASTRAATSPPAPAGAAPLLGSKWAALARTPEERLAAAVAGLPERCPDCSKPSPRGVGGVRSGLVLLTEGASGADATTLANMLVRVVGVEPADVWAAPPSDCPTCVASLVAQVEAVRPRVVLALGALAGTAVGARSRGELGRWAGVNTVWTFHPSEFAADPERKRPAFEALKLVASHR